MKIRFPVPLVSAATAALFVLILGCAAPVRILTPVSSGKAEAQRDVAQGKLRLLGYGLPAPWASEFNRILKDRYGIEHVYVAGCVVTDEIIQHTNAYNAVSMEAAKRKFGNDIFEKAEREAEHDWQTHDAAGQETAKR